MFRHNAPLRKWRPSSLPFLEPPPLPKWEGRGGERPPPLPLPFMAGEHRARLPAGTRGPRPCPGSRPGAAQSRTGREEECAQTGYTNPGCNYLVRGYSPSMHYFWRGDMPHFSPPLPFQRGRVGCCCVLARGGPPNPTADAVVRALHFGREGAPGRRRAADPLAGREPPRLSAAGPGTRTRPVLGSRPPCRRGPAGRGRQPRPHASRAGLRKCLQHGRVHRNLNLASRACSSTPPTHTHKHTPPPTHTHTQTHTHKHTPPPHTHTHTHTLKRDIVRSLCV